MAPCGHKGRNNVEQTSPRRAKCFPIIILKNNIYAKFHKTNYKTYQ